MTRASGGTLACAAGVTSRMQPSATTTVTSDSTTGGPEARGCTTVAPTMARGGPGFATRGRGDGVASHQGAPPAVGGRAAARGMKNQASKARLRVTRTVTNQTVRAMSGTGRFAQICQPLLHHAIVGMDTKGHLVV